MLEYTHHERGVSLGRTLSVDCREGIFASVANFELPPSGVGPAEAALCCQRTEKLEGKLMAAATSCPQRNDRFQSPWSYKEAFSRNLGLISPEEQERLRSSCVAIAGMGGVGGIHLETLARLGIGKFAIADGDQFEVANFNRQRGATIRTTGQPKAQVMAEVAKSINPDAEIAVINESITAKNIDQFLSGADVLVDAIDFFSFDDRRLIYAAARERGIWVVTAGPIGFSTAWLVFDPAGMSFEEYFDLHDGMSAVDQFAAFFMGLTPRGTHFPYFDLSYVDRRTARGPSVGLSCQLCSGVVGAEVVKILLKRKPIWPAPHYAQFDAYRCMLRQGRLRWGNRGPIQLIKRSLFRRQMLRFGYGDGTKQIISSGKSSCHLAGDSRTQAMTP
jgi:molybdopterin/thiamine biosynthesis adenylyltransferase